MATEEDSSSSNLPNDIVQVILSRLPVKPLLRFKTVSKSWNTMISDIAFIRMHLQQSEHSDTHNRFLHTHRLVNPRSLDKHISFVDRYMLGNPRNREIVFSLARVESRKFQYEEKLEYPRGWEDVLCTCQGVTLLSNYSYETYMLWNPSTRTESMFSFPYKFDQKYKNRFESYPVKYGLCHDPTIDDFKVVITSEQMDSGMDSDSGIFVDGAIYWVGMIDGYYRYNREIIYFDPRDDDFKILQKPPKNVKESEEFSLICLRGCLCLYYYSITSDYTMDDTMDGIVDDTMDTYKIWIKEKGRDKNSWNKLMTIENVEPTTVWFTPLCLLENNTILIRLDTRLVVYSPCTKTFEEFDEENPLSEVRLFPCLQSLLSPLENFRPKRNRLRT
ncbi:hypothetical protein DH2020_043675 [Rehmannia glutinosa]|uniref:F-box domain-containing protein n=1 Tax=Rehmannia glutinosa TaxID=99300 RepID=A0ABR0UK67_REHGL